MAAESGGSSSFKWMAWIVALFVVAAGVILWRGPGEGSGSAPSTGAGEPASSARPETPGTEPGLVRTPPVTAGELSAEPSPVAAGSEAIVEGPRDADGGPSQRPGRREIPPEILEEFQRGTVEISAEERERALRNNDPMPPEILRQFQEAGRREMPPELRERFENPYPGGAPEQ